MTLWRYSGQNPLLDILAVRTFMTPAYLRFSTYPALLPYLSIEINARTKRVLRPHRSLVVFADRVYRYGLDALFCLYSTHIFSKGLCHCG